MKKFPAGFYFTKFIVLITKRELRNLESKNLNQKTYSFSARRKARELVVQALYQLDFNQLDEKKLLSLWWVEPEKTINEESMEYYSTLLKKTLDHLEEIDEEIKGFAVKMKFEKMKAIDKALLRFGTSSILYELNLPAQIIINETIEISKDFAALDSYKFINGVLDGIRKKLIAAGQRTLQE
jgi:N utilization substance protein B